MNYKFRAWDKVNKKMINNISWKTLQANLFVNTSHGFAAQYDPQYEWLDVDLMLFTGLYDKNQVEVYEGDIVEFSEHYCGDSIVPKRQEVIEFIQGKFNDELCGVGYMDFSHNCTVLGNIYQNPELLNNKE